jgi:hypothetical protein
MTQYRDAGDLPEDTRIDLIGKTAMQQRKKVAFVTDADPGKADRYIAKLLERFPGLEVLNRGDGPVPDVVYVTVAPKGLL